VLAFGDVTTTRAGATTSTGVGAPTYAWTAATGWRLLHPTRSPGARSRALLAVSAGRLLMIDGAINTSSTTPCPSSSPSVSPDGSTVTQGCSSTGAVGPTRTPGDSWAWHGTSWQPARTRGLPPSGQAAVSDPALHGVVLVASTSHGNTVDLTRDIQGSWLLPDTGPRTWRLLSRTQPAGGQPAYDPHTRQLVAYTGNQAFIAGPGMGAPDRPGASSTSVLRAGRWVTLPGVPAEDADGVVATDPRTGRVLLYTELGHTFSWTGSSWHRQDTPGHPRAQRHHRPPGPGRRPRRPAGPRGVHRRQSPHLDLHRGLAPRDRPDPLTQPGPAHAVRLSTRRRRAAALEPATVLRPLSRPPKPDRPST